MILCRLAAFLWWSKFRWVFEPIMRRMVNSSTQIKTGPLRGLEFQGGLAQILGVYEFHIQTVISNHLSPGGVFYDIGANNGFFTLLGAQCVGLDGHVYSFEPFPKNIASIKNVIRRNSLSQCQLEECAVTDFIGETELFFSENIATPSITHKVGANLSSLRVSTMTLDNYFTTHLKPRLIKLDVEGAEVAVLRGAKDLIISANAPTWIIEIHSPDDEGEVLYLLAEGNYFVEKLHKPGNKLGGFPVHIVAKRK